MANINFLSWNVETYGPSKFSKVPSNFPDDLNPRAWPILQSLADTAALLGANIISILELKATDSAKVISYLKEILAFKTNLEWHCQPMPTQNDVYCVFYAMEQGFDLLSQPPAGGFPGLPVAGCTSADRDGNQLRYPSPDSERGGRPPGYVAFQTTDRPDGQNVIFTVLCYHAMFSKKYSKYGVQSIPSAAPVTTVRVAGADQNVTASFIGGDFNVDYITQPSPYDNAVNPVAGWVPAAVNPSLGDAAKTSLKNFTKESFPAVDYVNTTDYRENAYDNIFAHNPTTVVPAGGNVPPSRVIDLLSLFMSPAGALKECPYYFDPETLRKGPFMAFPMVTAKQSYAFYRSAISNHLPVFAQFTL